MFTSDLTVVLVPPIGRNFEVGVEAADVVGATIKINENLGELDLGKIDEEYIMGPDMNAILAKTVLDGDQMESIRDKSLYLIHTVIYSERFELKGNRRQEVYYISLNNNRFLTFEEIIHLICMALCSAIFVGLVHILTYFVLLWCPLIYLICSIFHIC